MHAHPFLADEQRLTDLRVRSVRHEVTEHLPLSRGQRDERRGYSVPGGYQWRRQRDARTGGKLLDAGLERCGALLDGVSRGPLE